MSGSKTSFPATAERIMVVPKAVAKTTAPSSQKSKYRHEILRSIPETYLADFLARCRRAAFKGISATRRCERPSCSTPICMACASISTCLDMVAIKSSLRESSSAGVKSVRSWIRTSCKRSLALSALFFLPNKRSKKLMLLPPRQPLNTIPNAILMIQRHERNSFTPQAFGDISECLACPAFRVECHRCTAVRTDDDIFILRDDTDQIDSQQIKHIFRRQHVVVLNQS